MHKKGQAALEFLTTYGWAFLVILVMIGALAYFGVLDPSRYVSESCSLPGGVTCKAARVTSTNIGLEVENNLDDTINITSIWIKDERSGQDCNITTGNAVGIVAKKKTGGVDTTAWTACSGTFSNLVGKKVSFDLTVIYEKSTALGLPQVAKGSLVTTVQ